LQEAKNEKVEVVEKMAVEEKVEEVDLQVIDMNHMKEEGQ